MTGLSIGLATFRLAAAVSTGLALAVSGAGFAAATTGAATTTVNIRSGPGTSHRIEGGLVRGQRITVTGRSRAGWVKVSFGGHRAYIAKRYIDTKGRLPAMPRRISTSGTKISTERLKVRTGPSTRYRAVGTLPRGRRITLTGAQRGGFAQMRYAGHKRWVSVGYLAKSRGRAAAPSPSPSPMPTTSAAKGRRALAFAKRQIGKPYVWGAEGPKSYDCSGLVQSAWKSVGVSLPRVARNQYTAGHKIAKSQLRAGDLVFFYTQRPRHVGIYVGGGRMIDAPRPGKVVRYTNIFKKSYSGSVRPG